MPNFTTSHAFIIGINEYQNTTSLNTAVPDATRLSDILTKQHGYYPHPPLLNATAQEIRDLLNDMVKEVKKEDRVIFYFAGHGISLKEEGEALVTSSHLTRLLEEAIPLFQWNCSRVISSS